MRAGFARKQATPSGIFVSPQTVKSEQSRFPLAQHPESPSGASRFGTSDPEGRAASRAAARFIDTPVHAFQPDGAQVQATIGLGGEAAERGADRAAQITADGVAPAALNLSEPGGGAPNTLQLDEIAVHGASGIGHRLPWLGLIQRSFGHHDISAIAAHSGESATAVSGALGAIAFTTGNNVVFGETPDLYTAAHEAAHVVQQRAGLSAQSHAADRNEHYERDADAVANLVAVGHSAESLLDRMQRTIGGIIAPSATVSCSAIPVAPVQMKRKEKRPKDGDKLVLNGTTFTYASPYGWCLPEVEVLGKKTSRRSALDAASLDFNIKSPDQSVEAALRLRLSAVTTPYYAPLPDKDYISPKGLEDKKISNGLAAVTTPYYAPVADKDHVVQKGLSGKAEKPLVAAATSLLSIQDVKTPPNLNFPLMVPGLDGRLFSISNSIEKSETADRSLPFDYMNAGSVITGAADLSKLGGPIGKIAKLSPVFDAYALGDHFGDLMYSEDKKEFAKAAVNLGKDALYIARPEIGLLSGFSELVESTNEFYYTYRNSLREQIKGIEQGAILSMNPRRNLQSLYDQLEQLEREHGRGRQGGSPKLEFRQGGRIKP